jgi:hypothetical protein
MASGCYWPVQPAIILVDLHVSHRCCLLFVRSRWPTCLPTLLSVICKVSCDLHVSQRCCLLFVRSRWPTCLPLLLSVICKVSCDLHVSHRCCLLFVRSRGLHRASSVETVSIPKALNNCKRFLVLKIKQNLISLDKHCVSLSDYIYIIFNVIAFFITTLFPRLCKMLAYITHICEKHFPGHIIPQIGYAWAHKTNFNTEVAISS